MYCMSRLRLPVCSEDPISYISSREKQEMTLFEQAHMNQFRKGEITQYNVKSIKKKLESLIYEYIKLVSVFSGIIPPKRK